MFREACRSIRRCVAACGFALGAALIVCPVARAQFIITFDSPDVNGSPAGVPLNGQLGFYVPQSGSVDGRVYAYDGNPLGIVQNPVGGDQFVVLQREPNAFARVQRDVPFNDVCWTVQFDFNLVYRGALPAANNAASVSIQPLPTRGSLVVMMNWDDVSTASAFSLRVIGYDDLGNVPSQAGIVIPNDAFRHLLANRWYRLSYRMEFASNRMSSISIRDLQSGAARVTYTPPSQQPSGYYLGGGSALRQGFDATVFPTAIRFFAGGGFELDPASGNTLAIDNLGTQPFSSDCEGDVDDDGRVQLNDLALLLINFGTMGGMTQSDGDLNCNGSVDLPDLALLLRNFGSVCGSD